MTVADDPPRFVETVLPGFTALPQALPRPPRPWPALLEAWRSAGAARPAPRVPAAQRYRIDFGRPPGQACWCADPVHLRLDLGSAFLAEADPLAQDEWQALRADLGAVLAGTPYRLEWPCPQRAYLLGLAPAASPPPPAALLGRDVSAHLLGGEAGRLATELQMVLRVHPVNRRRRAQGRRPVDALWLHGGTEQAPPAYDRVVGDDALDAALAPPGALQALAAWDGRGAVLAAARLRIHDPRLAQALAADLGRAAATAAAMAEHWLSSVWRRWRCGAWAAWWLSDGDRCWRLAPPRRRLWWPGRR